jgi:hypothetical protein
MAGVFLGNRECEQATEQAADCNSLVEAVAYSELDLQQADSCMLHNCTALHDVRRTNSLMNCMQTCRVERTVQRLVKGQGHFVAHLLLQQSGRSVVLPSCLVQELH